MPRVADLDSFYHIGHALAYLEGSVFDTSLPWATQSIIGDMGGDLWWGFHVLLMPFATVLITELGTIAFLHLGLGNGHGQGNDRGNRQLATGNRPGR